MTENNRQDTGRFNVWMPLLFALVLVVGMLIGMRLHPDQTTIVMEPQEEMVSVLGQGKLEELVRYIEAKYVDDVDRDELVDKTIASILQQLDPHSSYIPAEKLREINEQLEGNFEGIGVEFMILDDTLVVVSALAGGPSEAAGIRAGDKIIEVGDSVIAGVNIDSRNVMGLLRGEKGSQVEVGIRRVGESDLRRITITRDKIPMHSVDVAYMIDRQTGYIKINRFSATTYEEFMQALEKLVEEGDMEDLVIDLRHNPGGYLQQATNILSQLFETKDKLLVYTEGRSVHRSNYETTGRAFYDIDDVVVLIDEGSASASEILAGAVQDHDRGYIVGRRSFGKGLVQEQYRLRDGSALRLTVARYYTPSGRSIQKDYADAEHYEEDLQGRLESGELTSAAEMPIEDTTRYFTSSGRVVYGGGGIMPDVFVPMNEVFLDEDYLSLRQVVPSYVYRFMEEQGDRIDHYSLKEFQRRFQVEEETYRAFLKYAAEEGVQPAAPPKDKVKAELKRYLKARIAKHLFDDPGFYQVWNTGDPFLEKAMETLRDSKPITSK